MGDHHEHHGERARPRGGERQHRVGSSASEQGLSLISPEPARDQADRHQPAEPEPGRRQRMRGDRTQRSEQIRQDQRRLPDEPVEQPAVRPPVDAKAARGLVDRSCQPGRAAAVERLREGDLGGAQRHSKRRKVELGEERRGRGERVHG